MITILDYGLGNIGSLKNMFKRIRQNVNITSSPCQIIKSTKIVIPGVGSFDEAMNRINNIKGLKEALNLKALHHKIPILGVCLGMQLLTHKSEEGTLDGFKWIPGETKRFPKIPILGVCLGMQLLTHKSEEGTLDGFKWIPGETKRFPKSSKFKIPHMGWNEVSSRNLKSKLIKNINHDDRYYFVHSYYVKVHNEDHSLLKTKHNIEFDSAINKDNLYGVQFHPEKSHKYGMKILKNFSEISC